MDNFWNNPSILLEPGPAMFLLASEDGKGGEMLLGSTGSLNSSFSDHNEGPHSQSNNSFYEVNKEFWDQLNDENPTDISLTLDELKARGVRMEDILSIDGEESFENQENESDESSFTNDQSGKGKKRRLSDAVAAAKKAKTSKQSGGHFCKECRVGLKGMESVLNHMLQFHCYQKNFRCSLCSSELASESSVKKHVKNVHFRMEAFECPVCKKEIQQRSHLKQHIESVHGGVGALKEALGRAKSLVKFNPSFCKKALKLATTQTGENVSSKILTNSTTINTISQPMTVDDRHCHLCNRRHKSRETRDHHLLTFHHLKPADVQRHDEKFGMKTFEEKKSDESVSSLMDEVLQCGKCSLLCTSRLHFLLHAKDSHSLQDFSKPNKSGDFVPDQPAPKELSSPKIRSPPRERNSFIDVETPDLNPDLKPELKPDLNVDPKVLQFIEDSVKKMKPVDGLFPCEFCRSTEKYRSESDLINHVVAEHPYQCNHCQMKFVKFQSSMRKHFKTHHGTDIPYFCRFCTAVFNDPGQVERHSTDVHGENPEQNKVKAETPALSPKTSPRTPPKASPKTSPKPTATPAEATAAAAASGRPICIVCHVDYQSLSKLTEHVAEHHNYVCEVCHREYKLSDSIRKHCRKDHSDYFKEPIVCCRFCPSVFRSIPEKYAHIGEIHGIKMSGSKYTSASDSLNETPPIPAPEKKGKKSKFVCYICDPVLEFDGSSEDLDEHQFKVHPFTCDTCNKFYRQASTLRRHHQEVHGRSEVYVCNDCTIVLFEANDKKMHQLRCPVAIRKQMAESNPITNYFTKLDVSEDSKKEASPAKTSIILSTEDITIPEPYLRSPETFAARAGTSRSVSPGEFHGFPTPGAEDGNKKSRPPLKSEAP